MKGQYSLEEMRSLSTDLSTDPDVLRELGQSSDSGVREAVACNPNSPSDVLLRLGAEFPAQLLENPIFSLLLLENLNFVEEIPIQTLRSLLKQKNVPVYLLELTADRADLEIQLALTMNVQTSEGVLRRLTQSRHAQVVQAAQLHINLAGELTTDGYAQTAKVNIQEAISAPSFSSTGTTALATLAQICSIPDPISEHWVNQPTYHNLCRSLACSPATNPDVLRQLAHSRDSWTIGEVAQNPNTPTDTLRHIYTLGHEYGLGSNPNTPVDILVDILEKVSKFPNQHIRREVAQNSNAPLSVLEKLVEDPDSKISQIAIHRLISNQAVYSSEVLGKSAILSSIAGCNTKPIFEQDLETRRLVVQHPYVTTSILEILADDPDWFVRQTVAAHSNTPPSILEKLANDEDADVRKAIAANSNTPIHILEELAYDHDSAAPWEVARNPRTPLKILFKELARKPSFNHCLVYQMSTQHYNGPETENLLDLLAQESTSSLETILQRLIQEGSSVTRQFLASRWDLPIEFLSQLVNEFDQSERSVYATVLQHPNISATMLAQLSDSPEVMIRGFVSRHPNTAIATLEKLANDEIASVRLNIAERIDISSHVVEVLANDRDQTVRAKAMANPNFPKEAVETMLCGEYAAEYLRQNPYFLAQNQDVLAKVLNHYAQSPSVGTSFIALCQPQIVPELLQKKSSSTQWLERFAVAQNPQTSFTILQHLTEDANRIVRATAKNRMLQQA